MKKERKVVTQLAKEQGLCLNMKYAFYFLGQTDKHGIKS